MIDMTDLDLSDSEYRHVLDSLARYYNSQVTAHVGYLLTSIVVYCAIFSLITNIVVRNLDLDWQAQVIVAVEVLVVFVCFGVIYASVRFPLLPKYFLARTQYFMQLSDVVWNHLGLSSRSEEYFRQLKARALCFPLGIQTSIVRMFEARLYRSLLEQKDITPSDDLWETAFGVKELLAFGREHGWSTNSLIPSFKGKKILGLWKFGYDLTGLLEASHRSQLRGYARLYEKHSTTAPEYELGHLLKRDLNY
jgi:hypothetical protein